MALNVNSFNFNSSGQLLVTDTSAGTGVVTSIHEYDEASIASNFTTTIVTYTVPSGKNLKIRHFGFGGLADGEFVLEIDGTNEYTLRNSAAERDKERNISDGILVDELLVVNLKVTNCGDNLKSFEAVFNGVLFDKT